MKIKLFFISLISIFFLGCGNIVENLQKGNFKNSIELAKEMKKDEINKKYNGEYPLIVALEKGQNKIAKILINKGANVNVSKGNLSALDIAIIKDITTSNNDSDDIIALMISKGAKLKNYKSVISLIINREKNQYIDLILTYFPEYKNYVLNQILASKSINLIKYAINKKLFNDSQIDKIFKLNNSELITIVYFKYPKFKKKVFFYAIQNSDSDLLNYILNNNYPITKKDLKYIATKNNVLSSNVLLNVLEHSKKFQKTKDYKKILQTLKNRAIEENNPALLINCLNKNVKITKKDINKIFNKFSNNNFILELIYNKYPKDRNQMFSLALKNHNYEFIKLMLNNGFKLSKYQLQKVSKLQLNDDMIKTILNHSKHLKNTQAYKTLSLQLKRKEIIKNWNEFVRILNTKVKNGDEFIDKTRSILVKLVNQNVDKNIKKRADNILRFIGNFMQVMHNNKEVTKKLKKLLIGTKSIITQTMFMRSGPCLFGMCAGYNQATAYLTVKLLNIIDDDYARFKIIDINIHRDSVSDWNVYDKVVNALRSKYFVGKILKYAIADGINDTMWKIHTSGNRKGFSKKDLAFIGMYMSSAIATANTRDTGNWLVFDNMNCDAGIYVNRIQKIQLNNDVFDKSYKKMYKKCGWDKIK